MDNENGKNQSISNFLFSVIITSFIIIIMTSGITDSNGLSALIGGYSGLLFGILFIIIVNFSLVGIIDIIPFIIILITLSIMIYYLSIYFDKISNGEVAEYYNSFSVLSTIFLASQLSIIYSELFSSFKNNSINKNILSPKMFSLLLLLGTINFLIVITIGVVLHFYSTQG